MSRRLRRRYGRANGGFRVAYLGAHARRTYLHGEFSLAGARVEMRRLKRRGLTTWVETASGQFVPVPGAKRQPSFLGDA